MPSSISRIFASAGLVPSGVVRWGERIPLSLPGVYAVALAADPDSGAAYSEVPPISVPAIHALISRCPQVEVDGQRATPQELEMRLAEFWLPDEVVVYVGLAGNSLQGRVDQFYRTQLGARGPHRGGWFVKTLILPGELCVHYAACDHPAVAEDEMLRAFSSRVSAESRAKLHDSDQPIPFANLEWPRGRIKRHGIHGVYAVRGRS